MNRARQTVAVAMGLTLLAGAPSNATSSASAPSITPHAIGCYEEEAGAEVQKKAKKKAKKRGTLRVVAQGFRREALRRSPLRGSVIARAPAAGNCAISKPGKYRVWAAPIVVDGGTSSVSDLPVRVKVRRAIDLRLQVPWNPRTDSLSGPADELKVSGRTTLRST